MSFQCPLSPSGLPAYTLPQDLLHECVYTPTDLLSLILGYLSILMWLFAQFPQLYKNAVNGSAESLSLLFIFNWLSGDVFNLVGCVLTDQLPFQVYLAIYFVFIDASLFLQVIYFRYLKPSPKVTEEEVTPLLSDNDGGSMAMILVFGIFGMLKGSNTLPASEYSILGDYTASSIDIGTVMAWSCTFLYFTSRLPQIILNFKRHTTEGLAIVMFCCALTGNVLYVASILIKSLEPSYLYRALPYLLGSGGTVFFDIIILYQYLTYPRIESQDLQ